MTSEVATRAPGRTIRCMEEVRRYLRTEEWEAEVGAQVRDLRLRRRQTQRDLARAANVSVAALQRLEAGKGSSLATFVGLLRALGRDSWLRQIAPPVTVSPMDALRQRRRAAGTATTRAPKSAPG